MAPERNVRVRAAVLDAIGAHARAERPRECCGLLIGLEGHLIEAVATTNASDDPLRRFEIPPRDHIRLIKRCRTLTEETGLRHDVVGAYHSHPNSAPVPSPTDLAQAFEDFIYVIAGPADEETFAIRAYRLEAGGFEALELIAIAQ